MVIDSSAFIAMLEGEPEGALFLDLMERDSVRLASAATMAEASIVVLARRGEPGIEAFRLFAEKAGVAVAPVQPEHVVLAVDGFRRYGKGRHPARLNFGDCFSYALAKATGERLLFKGNDFSRTDIAAAV